MLPPSPGDSSCRQAANGAHASSFEVDEGCIGAVPCQRTKQIRQALALGGAGPSLPTEGIPEEDGPEEVPVDDSNAEPDSDEYVPEDGGWRPTARQFADLKLARDNSGHPSNLGFVRLLRGGSAKPEVGRWVLGFFQVR